jgi:hypothetical protein
MGEILVDDGINSALRGRVVAPSAHLADHHSAFAASKTQSQSGEHPATKLIVLVVECEWHGTLQPKYYALSDDPSRSLASTLSYRSPPHML